MVNKIYVSEKGLEILKENLKKANDDLAAIRTEKNTAYTATGDTWHDNPYFNELEREERKKIEKIAEFQTLIANAQVFSTNQRNTSRVQLGSIVRLRRYYKVSGEEEEAVWEIVGYGETDAPKKQVAYNAPIARAVIGLQIGDITESNTPKGPAEYEILDLYGDWDEVPKQLQ